MEASNASLLARQAAQGDHAHVQILVAWQQAQQGDDHAWGRWAKEQGT
jgi:hypothetical protein